APVGALLPCHSEEPRLFSWAALILQVSFNPKQAVRLSEAKNLTCDTGTAEILRPEGSGLRMTAWFGWE
ncbi:MAG: hypothetical protein V3R29_07175, partial [Candidatus Acidoferrales bacterium]